MAKKKRKQKKSTAFLHSAGQSLVYYGYRGIEFLLSLTPIGIAFSLGRLLGFAAWLILPGYRRLAIRNLTIAFGEEHSSDEIKRLAREHFRTLGANLLCSIKMSTMPVEAIAERVQITGMENARSAADYEQGLIYAICHMGCWEALAQMPAISPGVEAATLYQKLSNTKLDEHIRRRRSRWGRQTVRPQDWLSQTACPHPRQGWSGHTRGSTCWRQWCVVPVFSDDWHPRQMPQLVQARRKERPGQLAGDCRQYRRRPDRHETVETAPELELQPAGDLRQGTARAICQLRASRRCRVMAIRIDTVEVAAEVCGAIYTTSGKKQSFQIRAVR